MNKDTKRMQIVYTDGKTYDVEVDRYLYNKQYDCEFISFYIELNGKIVNKTRPLIETDEGLFINRKFNKEMIKAFKQQKKENKKNLSFSKLPDKLELAEEELERNYETTVYVNSQGRYFKDVFGLRPYSYRATEAMKNDDDLVIIEKKTIIDVVEKPETKILYRDSEGKVFYDKNLKKPASSEIVSSMEESYEVKYVDVKRKAKTKTVVDIMKETSDAVKNKISESASIFQSVPESLNNAKESIQNGITDKKNKIVEGIEEAKNNYVSPITKIQNRIELAKANNEAILREERENKDKNNFFVYVDEDGMLYRNNDINNPISPEDMDIISSMYNVIERELTSNKVNEDKDLEIKYVYTDVEGNFYKKSDLTEPIAKEKVKKSRNKKIILEAQPIDGVIDSIKLYHDEEYKNNYYDQEGLFKIPKKIFDTLEKKFDYIKYENIIKKPAKVNKGFSVLPKVYYRVIDGTKILYRDEFGKVEVPYQLRNMLIKSGLVELVPVKELFNDEELNKNIVKIYQDAYGYYYQTENGEYPLSDEELDEIYGDPTNEVIVGDVLTENVVIYYSEEKQEYYRDENGKVIVTDEELTKLEENPTIYIVYENIDKINNKYNEPVVSQEAFNRMPNTTYVPELPINMGEAEPLVVINPNEVKEISGYRTVENELTIVKQPSITDVSVINQPSSTEVSVINQPSSTDVAVINQPSSTGVSVVEPQQASVVPVEPAPVVTAPASPQQTSVAVVKEPTNTSVSVVNKPANTSVAVVKQPVNTKVDVKPTSSNSSLDKLRELREQMANILYKKTPFDKDYNYDDKDLEGIENKYEHSIEYQLDDWEIDKFQELRDEVETIKRGR